MDGRGGCCIARYHGGGGAAAYDMSKVDRIMLRFRPIAPKPANSGSTSPPEVTEVSPKSGRGKKRFNNGNGNNSKRCNNGSNNRKRKVNEEKVDVAVVTLPLLPETPDRKETSGRESPVELFSPRETKKSLPTWLSFGNNNSTKKVNDHMAISGSFATSTNHTVSLPQAMRVVIGSCVTVECVTDTWVDVDGLGRTDEERKRNLERDTCPGFISDDFGRVTWTNDAYRKMVEGEMEGGEVVVWLVMKDKVTVTAALGGYNNRAFTCRVRVQNQKTYGNTKEKSSITVPCDVWRMDNGGFAWRLDVKAALSLGR